MRLSLSLCIGVWPAAALAEVCDKLRPDWRPGEAVWPEAYIAAIMVAAGIAAGLLSARHLAWLLLPLVVVGALLLVRDHEMMPLGRSEGCVPQDWLLALQLVAIALLALLASRAILRTNRYP